MMPIRVDLFFLNFEINVRIDLGEKQVDDSRILTRQIILSQLS